MHNVFTDQIFRNSLWQKTKPDICFKTCGWGFQKHSQVFQTNGFKSITKKKGLVESRNVWSIFYNLVFVLWRSSSYFTVANSLRVIFSSEMTNISVVDVFYYQSRYPYRKKSLCAKSKTEFQVITSVV